MISRVARFRSPFLILQQFAITIFSGNRFVTSGTEQRYYLWKRSVHRTTRPASMARPDPLWGQSCRDFSTLRDRQRSCECRSIIGACKDVCSESPKNPCHKKTPRISSMETTDQSTPKELPTSGTPSRLNKRQKIQRGNATGPSKLMASRILRRHFWDGQVYSSATPFERSQTPLATVNCDHI